FISMPEVNAQYSGGNGKGDYATTSSGQLCGLTASSTATDNGNGTMTVVVTAANGTTPYSGTGSFTSPIGAYSYTVSDASGCTAVTTGNPTLPVPTLTEWGLIVFAGLMLFTGFVQIRKG